MARKKKAPPAPPSKAYLVSFGDTMTALLAFFIVLNSLAKEQTGANMYSGTGSFINAVKSLGVPGQFSGNRSSNMIRKEAPSPIYAVPNNDPNAKKGKGPDDTNDEKQIIDREQEDFQRFLNEMERKFSLEASQPIREQVVLDCWTKLKDEGGPFNQNALQMALESVAQLQSPEAEIEIIFWASMPSPKMLEKSAKTAVRAAKQFDSLFKLPPSSRKRIRFASKPWLFSDAKRPIVSFVISRMKRDAK